MQRQRPLIQLGTSTSFLTTLSLSGDEETPGASQPMTLTRNQLAHELQVSSRTISRMVERGELPLPKTIGKSLRWYRPDVAEWLRCTSQFAPRREQSPSSPSKANHA